MSCCFDFFLREVGHRGSGRAGGNPPSARLAGFAALLPPCGLVYGPTRRFVGWAERSEAQRAGEITLGFSRTVSGISPTYTAAFGVSQACAAGVA